MWPRLFGQIESYVRGESVKKAAVFTREEILTWSWVWVLVNFLMMSKVNRGLFLAHIVNCCWLTHKKIPLKATFLDRRPPPCPSYSKQRDRQEREARGEHDAKKVWQKSLKSWSRFVSVIKVWTLTAGHHLWLAASFHYNLSKRHLPEFSIFGVLEENIVK